MGLMCNYVVSCLGRVNGAVTLPVPVSRQLASGIQSSPLNSLLGAAGIRSATHPPQLLHKCLLAFILFIHHWNLFIHSFISDIAEQAVLLVFQQLHLQFFNTAACSKHAV